MLRMALDLVIAAILLALAGSALAWLSPRTSLVGQRIATATTALSMLAGLSGAGLGLAREAAALAGRSVGALPGMGALDPLQEALWERHRIEVPIFMFQGTKCLRVSAHLHSTLADAETLAAVLPALLRE